jgi:YD repeat-containing protein
VLHSNFGGWRSLGRVAQPLIGFDLPGGRSFVVFRRGGGFVFLSACLSSIGSRTPVTDALSHQTTFAYDAGDRLTTITYPDSTTTSFSR